MGGSSSTRKVSFEEEESSGIVKISEDVVRRLNGEEPLSGGKAGDDTVSSAKLQQQQQEMKQLQKYYDDKVKYLEKKNAELYQTTTAQFAKAVQEVEEKFVKQTSSPVCQELQSEVMACYNANPKHILLCSPQVQAFTDCVDKYRQNKLTRGNGTV